MEMPVPARIRTAIAAIFLASAAAPLLCAAAPLAPEAAWKAAISDQNKDYAQVTHAMLKIQDSAYLGEGQSAVLTGKAGDPGSWHWREKGRGPLVISFAKGELRVVLNGKTFDPKRAAKSIPVDKDVDVVGQPTQVGAGVNGWRLFVYNQKNPDALKFTGVSYYPYDGAFRLEAGFKPDNKLPPRVFRTSRGTDKQFYHAGDASFTLKGKSVTLPFYAESNNPKDVKEMSAFYTDDLTGKGAYGAGRYVDVADFGKFPPSKVIIDFNQAYNPNCARSAHFTCPLAVDVIPLAMTAGERDPHLAH
jgi:uncharacterized protein (DUF1684 family)